MTNSVARINLTIITSLSVSLVRKLHTDSGVTAPRISLTLNEMKVIINSKDFVWILDFVFLTYRLKDTEQHESGENPGSQLPHHRD